MNLGFLASGALGLLVLVAGPVLAHLALQKPVERQAFGAMMLLERLVRRLKRRRRVHDLLLLAMRVLAVALVVLAAAGPELRLDSFSQRIGGTGRVVVILDDSLSMSLGDESALSVEKDTGTLLARARTDAVELVRNLPVGTRVGAVLTTAGDGTWATESGAARLTPALDESAAAVATLLEGVEPTYQGTDLGGAFRQARGLLQGQPGEVVVFTDEAGPQVIEAARTELTRLLDAGGILVPRPVRASSRDNLTVTSVTYGDGLEGGSVRARVMGYGENAREAPLTASLPGDKEMTAFVQVPPCDEDVCSEVEEIFTVPREVPGGVAKVTVGDERLPADNARYFHLPRVGASRVLVVDGDPGPTPTQSEVYFLERALAPWGNLRTGVTPDVMALAGLGGIDLAGYRVIFLSNVADPGPFVDRISAFVRAGGGLVLSGGDNVTPDVYNASMSTLLPASLRKARDLVALDAEGGVPLLPPDATLEIFRPFSREGRGGFPRVHFRRVLTFDPYPEGDPAQPDAVRTLLGLEGGLPLLVERRLGAGRVLFLTGTVDLAWGNLPLEAVFVPLVQRIVGYLGGESAGGVARFTGTTGESVQIALPDASLQPVVIDPGGRAVQARVSGGAVRFVPYEPGAYTLALPGGPPLAWVAVNVPLAETDVRTWGGIADLAREVMPSVFVRRIALSPWVLWGALAFLLGQAIAGRVRVRGEAP